ncbi:hypothetical protein QTO34_004172 [Cnephaeus nilssonii]|uniref:C2H2-type domain-containing protein n=1 Tax=Cnephaeus nilssonii TaxID=3371016 RepID=A0AA40HSU0_CNENI|nr:hypothetical protein QTO34_004172 [Eptesicus nilssonii]
MAGRCYRHYCYPHRGHLTSHLLPQTPHRPSDGTAYSCWLPLATVTCFITASLSPLDFGFRGTGQYHGPTGSHTGCSVHIACPGPPPGSPREWGLEGTSPDAGPALARMGKEWPAFQLPEALPALSPTGTDMAVFCLLCGKRFQAQSALQQHMEVHAGVRSYICSECNRTFPSHTALKRHLRSHTGDHPYECEFCGSCFRDESTLKSHKRIHTGEKPYECNGCGKKFSLKHQLETHYRVHTGEKPFECKLCHQRSRDYSAMIKHLRTHNGASPYQCTICTEYCPSLSSMQKHMKGHKPEEIPPDWRIEKTYLYLCYV